MCRVDTKFPLLDKKWQQKRDDRLELDLEKFNAMSRSELPEAIYHKRFLDNAIEVEMD